MVCGSKRICTRVGGCPRCRCYRAVRAIACRRSAAAACGHSDTWFPGDRGATGCDYDHSGAYLYASGVDHHGDPRPTGSDEYAPSTTGNVNADAPRIANVNSDTYSYLNADALNAGCQS